MNNPNHMEILLASEALGLYEYKLSVLMFIVRYICIVYGSDNIFFLLDIRDIVKRLYYTILCFGI